MLEEEVVKTVVEDESIRVVRPPNAWRKVELRSIFFTVRDFAMMEFFLKTKGR